MRTPILWIWLSLQRLEVVDLLGCIADTNTLIDFVMMALVIFLLARFNNRLSH